MVSVCFVLRDAMSGQIIRSQSEFSSLPWMMYSAGLGDELLVLVVLSVINKAALSLTVGMAPLKLNGGDPTKNLLGMLLGGGEMVQRKYQE